MTSRGSRSIEDAQHEEPGAGLGQDPPRVARPILLNRIARDRQVQHLMIVDLSHQGGSGLRVLDAGSIEDRSSIIRIWGRLGSMVSSRSPTMFGGPVGAQPISGSACWGWTRLSGLKCSRWKGAADGPVGLGQARPPPRRPSSRGQGELLSSFGGEGSLPAPPGRAARQPGPAPGPWPRAPRGAEGEAQGERSAPRARDGRLRGSRRLFAMRFTFRPRRSDRCARSAGPARSRNMAAARIGSSAPASWGPSASTSWSVRRASLSSTVQPGAPTRASSSCAWARHAGGAARARKPRE